MSTPAKTVRPGISQSFDLQSLIDSHAEPFVVIDRNYRIVAVNAAYARAYGAFSSQAVGQTCYRISHNKDQPCHRNGEECPHINLFKDGKQYSCIHTHLNGKNHLHQVRVTAVPLYDGDGQLFMGELLQPILPDTCGCEQESKHMAGNSQAFTACLEQLRLVAAANAPVLVQGETGTGKELAASFIHSQSPRSGKPYLTVDCTALTDTLFEAEIFGHERGAYTGSVGEKPGLFDQADGGTLFLDEVGELPLTQQAKLLRVLETGKYRRVGGRSIRKVNVRIICATNRHLWEAVTAGTFREDLYYRIACLSVRLPSLRERKDDIPLLAECLLEPVRQSMQRSISLTADAVECLKTYHYPGNVRELRNILIVAATHAADDEIGETVIERVIRQLAGSHSPAPAPVRVNTRGDAGGKSDAGKSPDDGEKSAGNYSLKDAEAQHIRALLAQHNGSRRKVAAMLEISERTLYRKLKKYGLY
ncbi:MAG: sigma 54-interacting transcriptional regulator [Gammaproteobacteria bacterium]|nr:sigma 54-interacting transcriptional regulator [Gammaproteobacteria bacterium]MDH5514222.1 sigma 54-interacting transcriptional regulator [Gammaproteobacteria bacterium]